MLILLVTACAGENGEVAQQNSETTQQNGETAQQDSETAQTEEMQEFYYTIEETTLPSPEKSVMVPEGGDVLLGEPVLLGGHVLCTASVYDRERNNTGFYMQILEPGAQEWKNIDVLNSAFELDGVQYDGINSKICSSADGEMYAEAYIKDAGNYLGRLEPEGIQEIICTVPEEFKEEWEYAQLL